MQCMQPMQRPHVYWVCVKSYLCNLKRLSMQPPHVYWVCEELALSMQVTTQQAWLR